MPLNAPNDPIEFPITDLDTTAQFRNHGREEHRPIHGLQRIGRPSHCLNLLIRQRHRVHSGTLVKLA
jgi:hypothetical protein